MSAVADCKHGKPATLCATCLAPRPTWRPSRKACQAAVFRWIHETKASGASRWQPIAAMRRALLAAWRVDHPEARGG